MVRVDGRHKIRLRAFYLVVSFDASAEAADGEGSRLSAPWIWSAFWVLREAQLGRTAAPKRQSAL